MEAMTFLVIFLVFDGLVSIGIGLFFGYRNNKVRYHSDKRTKGIVMGYHEMGNGCAVPVVEFEVKGVTYQSKLRYRSYSFVSPRDKGEAEVVGDPLAATLKVKHDPKLSANPLETVFPLGSEMTVFYNRNNSDENYVERHAGSSFPKLLSMSGLGVILIAGLFYFLFVQ